MATGNFEARFVHCFHTDLPPPLPRVHTFPVTKRRQQQQQPPQGPSRWTHTAAPAFLQLASDIIPVVVRPVTSTRTSSNQPARSSSTFQGPAKLVNHAPPGGTVSSVASSQKVQEEQQQQQEEALPRRVQGKTKGEITSELNASPGRYREASDVEGARGRPEAHDTHKSKTNSWRGPRKDSLKAKKERKRKTIQVKLLPDDVRKAIIAEAGGVDAACGTRKTGDSQGNQEHTYEEIQASVGTKTVKVRQQNKTKTQAKGSTQKTHLSLDEISERNCRAHVKDDPEDHITAETERRETQPPKKKVPPPKPPRKRVENDKQSEETKGGCSENCVKNPEMKDTKVRPVVGPHISNPSGTSRPTTMHSGSTKSCGGDVKNYLREALEGSPRQRAASFSPPRRQEDQDGRLHKCIRRRSSRSLSASGRNGTVKRVSEFTISAEERSKRSAPSPRNKPSFMLSIVTPMGSLWLSGGRCRPSPRNKRRSCSLSPAATKQRLSRRETTPPRRRSLSPPQHSQSDVQRPRPTHHKAGQK